MSYIYKVKKNIYPEESPPFKGILFFKTRNKQIEERLTNNFDKLIEVDLKYSSNLEDFKEIYELIEFEPININPNLTFEEWKQNLSNVSLILLREDYHERE